VLQKLHITNYAIIQEVTIDFTNGFTIITGETGAGKSILLGALSLILGDRADATTLLNTEKKCIVEGIFKTPLHNKSFAALLQELDIEKEAEIIIRREIAPTGKSRAFINDSPVNLSQLRAVSSLLVDLHQQFDTLELGEQDFQRAVVDAMAKQEEPLKKYQEVFKQVMLLKKEIEQLQKEQAEANKTYDYNKFLYEELAEINLQPSELEQLEEELKLLSNAENIKGTLLQMTNLLTDGETPLVQQLKQLQQSSKGIAAMHKGISLLHDRLKAATIELDDIASELEQINDSVSLDNERIEVVNDRINIGYKLLKKHNVQTTDELIAIKETLDSKLLLVSNATELIKVKEKEINTVEKKAVEQAQLIHTERVKASEPLAKKITQLLAQVGMPNAILKVELKESALNQYGASSIDFLFDANKSGRFEPIRKVASGGELSRLMLCIKSLVAHAMQLPVLIFDEIDTGISGEAARQVGLIMNDLAKQHQVICITHQAQIAAKATTHFFVYKAIEKNAITTGIKTLTQEERITTIAQMLSGEKPTTAALQNAREMVGN
jgi:DNA repair protein RecN (Recombination protein N)